MTNNKRPENMIRITNEELAKAFIDEQIKAIKEQVKDMEKRGLMVNDIRIGMNNNDLYDEVKECYKITNNMLLNYNYHNYEGDANSKNGQAIVVLR